MKKNIDLKTLNNLLKIDSVISKIPNTVPNSFRKTFNFKGRKSPDIARAIMNTVCEDNTILYEPFFGSGSFLIAALGKFKKIYGTELDNYTFEAFKALMYEIDLEEFSNLFKKVEMDSKHKILELYKTKCCNSTNIVSKILFDPEEGIDGYFKPTKNREIVLGKNVKLVNKCPICGKKSKKFDNFDLQILKEVEKLDISRFPTHKYIENSRINITVSTGANKYDRIFSHRNKRALLILQDSILKLEPSKERDVLEHVLVASLSLSRIAMYGSSTDILYHVIGHGAQDMNVWYVFEEKYYAFLKFKKEYLDFQIKNDESFIIKNESYSTFIDSNDIKVDYIYTDFPYTDQVPYLERNQLYRVWLNNFYDKDRYVLTEEMLSEEIVLTNAPQRSNKGTIESYYSDIDKMFSKFNKILKEQGLVFFTINLGKSKYFKTYIEIINLARKNGFEYIYQNSIEKKDPTIRKQSAFMNTLMNEMIVVFYKLPEKDRYWYIGNDNYEFLLVKKIYSYILNQKTNVTLTSATSLIINDIKSKYSFICEEREISLIKDVIRNNFIVDNGIVQIDSNKLYFDIEDQTDLYTKLFDLIPIYIRKVIDQKKQFVLEDIYFELINSICDGNPKTIIQILEDESHQNDIERLILNYCNVEEGCYVERNDIIKPNENAIDISTLTGSEFEELVKKLLIAEGYENVALVGGAGDLGVDIIASKIEDAKVKHFIFQCKRWASNVGSDPLQRLFAERVRRGLDEAICVTTSGYTKDGKLISKELGIGIIDGTELIQKLNKYFPGEYYNVINS